MAENTNSILASLRPLLVGDSTDTSFDKDLTMHINSALFDLAQLGVGPTGGLVITGEENTWSELLTDSKLLESVKTYIYLNVRIVFDPPTSGVVMDAWQKKIDKYEWSIRNAADTTSTTI